MRRLLALVALTPLALMAHEGGPLQPDDLWRAWELEPGIVIPLALSAWLYARGMRHATRRQAMFFWSGLATLALALVSPLHPLGEVLFSAHMAQHEILMLVAAPLLVLSRPLVPLLWALPANWRRAAGRWFQAPAGPFTAWWVHAAALWIWHAPPLFQATLRNEWIHAAQHLSFFLSALLFWWTLFDSRMRAASVFYVFTTAVHTGILGALLTFAPVVLYPAYSATAPLWGLTPLQDQQIGGLIMWVPAGVVYLVLAMLLLRRSLVLAACMALLLAGCGARTSPEADRGASAISRYGCGSCHSIAGISSAHGLVGPPLTGVRDRMYIAGMLNNQRGNLIQWIRDPKSVNPKTAMPKLGVSEQDAADIVAYLYSK